MAETLAFAVAGAGALLLGSGLAAVWMPPRQVVAVCLAFASGALVAALAFELFAEADRRGGLAIVAAAFFAGAVVFVAADWALDWRFGGKRGSGLAIAAAVTLDGIPESLALGITLVHGGSFVLLIAIFASNFSEALSGTAEIRRDGRTGEALLVWSTAALALGAAIVLGRYAFSDLSDGALAALLAFAAGAVLASLADTLMPEAYDEGGPYVALATAAGFLLSYALSTA